jgi:hypothetical protein
VRFENGWRGAMGLLGAMNNAQRQGQLRQFGETVVFEQLEKNEYRCLFTSTNFPCFDIEAHKGNQKFLVQVKTRSHTTATGDIKTDTYGLFHKNKAGDVDTQVRMARQIAEQQNAVQLWAAVTVNTSKQLYTICYGRVDDLPNKKQIPMSPSDIRRHKKLAENVFDKRIDPNWSNVRRLAVA